MIGTYAAVLAVCGASLLLGQTAIALCGWGRWSWLSPAVGLALLTAICWGTVRLPGDGTVSAIAVLGLALASVIYLRGRVEGGGEALRAGWPVALLALAAASLPFAVEGHFGILGTSFNPDMSQHLLATDRLAHGETSELLRQGYPLGPHAIVVTLNKGLGVGLVQGFDGLTVAVAVLAPLTALTAFSSLRPVPRTAAALAVGLAYLVASYFAQGAFKETMQALFVLAFALSLRESTRAWSDLPLRFVPAALLAVGPVYTYSFPGLIWLAGTAAIWAIAEYARTRSATSAGGVGGGPPYGATRGWPARPCRQRQEDRYCNQRSRDLDCLGGGVRRAADPGGQIGKGGGEEGGKERGLPAAPAASDPDDQQRKRKGGAEVIRDGGNGAIAGSETEVARGPDPKRLERRDLSEEVAETWTVGVEGLEAVEVDHAA